MKYSWVCGSTRSSTEKRGIAVRVVLLVSAALLLASSCSPHPQGPPPKGMIKKEKLVNLLVEFHYIEGVYSSTAALTRYHLYADSLDFYGRFLEKYGIDKEAFRETMNYYSYNPFLFEEVYDMVIDELNRRLSDLEIELADYDDDQNE